MESHTFVLWVDQGDRALLKSRKSGMWWAPALGLLQRKLKPAEDAGPCLHADVRLAGEV